MPTRNLLALDVGEKRIGMAMADTAVRIAVPFGWLEHTETILTDLAEVLLRHEIDVIVVGYPRNQSGEPTAQTAYAEAFAAQLDGMVGEIVFQDESLTSVMAEDQLKKDGKPYTKGDIDARAAAIILQDYLELHA